MTILRYSSSSPFQFLAPFNSQKLGHVAGEELNDFLRCLGIVAQLTVYSLRDPEGEINVSSAAVA